MVNKSRPLFFTRAIAAARGTFSTRLGGGLVFLAIGVLGLPAFAEPMYPIVIDGLFGDWADVPSYTDPVDDTHDTDHDGPFDVPAHVQHEDVDLVEFKFTHDEENLYAYFRATGVIGRTQHESAGTPGRYYVIVTIDVDSDDATGYWLHEGGYYPTSAGYDMNMEVEYYNGAFNTGHYLNHGCLDEAEFLAAQADQANGIVDVRPGTYDWYTQWVWWDTPQGNPGEIILPDGSSTIIWVQDRGPVYQGILEIALSPDGRQAEVMAPFRGFMKYPDGSPIIALGRTIDVSFSLEASGELAIGGEWASDTAEPILGYYLDSDNEDVSASRSFWYYKYASPGVEEVTVTIDNKGVDDLTALEVVEELPAGWSFHSLAGYDPPGCGPATSPSSGATGTLEFVWSCIPAFPYTFTYRVNVPSGQTGDKTFWGGALYQRVGGTAKTAAIGGLRLIQERIHHTLDYNPANNLISVSEILRVIQFYNIGGYHCAVGTEDGYQPGLPGTPDPSWVPHDNDYNPQDWKINVSEILRPIQFYNLGGYHVAESTEDGYAPGPAAKAGIAKASVIGDATAPALYATRGIVANGDASDVKVTFTSVGAEPISALALVEALPAGWTFDGVIDASEPPAIAPVQGDSGELNFVWIRPPAFPAHVTYRVRSESGEAGVTRLTGTALYRSTGSEQQAHVAYEPDGFADGHAVTGDVNGDGKVDAIDLQLVINAALGAAQTLTGGVSALNCDVDGSGAVNAVDVQIVTMAAVG